MEQPQCGNCSDGDLAEMEADDTGHEGWTWTLASGPVPWGMGGMGEGSTLPFPQHPPAHGQGGAAVSTAQGCRALWVLQKVTGGTTHSRQAGGSTNRLQGPRSCSRARQEARAGLGGFPCRTQEEFWGSPFLQPWISP